jgi:hypothetical protein
MRFSPSPGPGPESIDDSNEDNSLFKDKQKQALISRVKAEFYFASLWLIDKE